MNRKNLILLTLLSFTNIFSQNFELRATPFLKSNLIYNDKTSEKGLLRLASSVFDLRFKLEMKDKEIKIDFKKVDKIIINPETKRERIFQFKNHNYGKFKIFTELVYSDLLSIYISLNEPMNLFYSNFDRETISEMVNQARTEKDIDNIYYRDRLGFAERLKKTDTLNLPNGKKIKLPSSYGYVNGLSITGAFGINTKFTYYLLKQGDPLLYRVEKNKRYLKKARNMLDDCPCIIRDLEQKKIMVEDLARYIEYYKDVCLD